MRKLIAASICLLLLVAATPAFAGTLGKLAVKNDTKGDVIIKLRVKDGRSGPDEDRTLIAGEVSEFEIRVDDGREDDHWNWNIKAMQKTSSSLFVSTTVLIQEDGVFRVLEPGQHARYEELGPRRIRLTIVE